MPNIANISLNTAEALLPTAYSLQEVTFTNHAGREFDLKALVTDFTITESIYRPSLVLSLNIRDPVNTLEEFEMTGQEKINLKVSRKPYGVGDDIVISLPFIVTEYPVFGRFNNRLQSYSVRGVSPFAFVSELKKISRSFSGTIQDFVKSVLKNDLGVKEEDMMITNSASAVVKFIVPNLAPLDAIHWAIRRAYDPSGSPFYFYQRLDGKIILETHAEIVAKESMQEYIDAKFYQFNHSSDANIKLDYEERAKRILSLASDIRMSKYTSIPSGAFSSRTDYLDLSTKTLDRAAFDYSKEFTSMKWLEKNKVLSPNFKPGDEQDPISNFNDSLINYVPINSLSYNGQQNYHSPTRNSSLNRAQSYVENLDSMVHDISLCGDFDITSGKVISLKIPPAIDFGAQILNSLKFKDPKRDEYFSGKYVVTAVVHDFSEDYVVNLKIKRDTLPFKLTS